MKNVGLRVSGVVEHCFVLAEHAPHAIWCRQRGIVYICHRGAKGTQFDFDTAYVCEVQHLAH